jgi:hypothetical protein
MQAPVSEDREMCLCAICRVMIMQSEMFRREIADLVIRKAGELHSIELAHIECAKQQGSQAGWKWEGSDKKDDKTGIR